jgi:spermidine/putrescine transport system ATP-binding protein
MPRGTPLLEILHVTRRFGALTAVDGVSLSVRAGEFFTLLGPSGCGKTTLLRLIAGFERPDSGQLLLEGRDLTRMPPERRPVHTVFQNYALFPHLTAAQNVAFPLQMIRCRKEEIRSRVAEALRMVHLDDFADTYPASLSGGQRQRVAIARALIDRPRLLLLDEPLAALDLKLRQRMQLELIRLQREVGITFAYVTHDQGEALALSHRVAVMNQGRIEQVDEPAQLYSFPNSRFVADFIGSCNFLPAAIQWIRDGYSCVLVDGLGEIRIPTAVGHHVGGRGMLALRPEKVRLAPGQETHPLTGYIRALLFRGEVTAYTVELPGGMRVEALLPNAAAGKACFFELGQPVALSWPEDAGHFLVEAQ